MDRLKDLSELWNWLPAFRAVGETEHLPTAGTFLRVSPAALSRSIALLERALGRSLFERRDRRLHLNASGQVLLGALRQAMELLEEGVDTARAEVPRRPLRVCSSSQTGTSLVLAGLEELPVRLPEVAVEIAHPPPGESLERLLLQGFVDLLVGEEAKPRSGLTVQLLGEFTAGLYCGHGHALFRRRKVRLEELSAHPFVGPPATDGPPLDDWPPHVPRDVVVRVPHVYAAMRVCAQGRLLAILPDRVVDSSPGSLKGVLRRIPLEVIKPTQLYATHRQGPRPATRVLLQILSELSA